ncbi:MAG: hypothetical protein QNK37_25890 [Acidobacteriota bacterium]|nr:hypothetical protein [Acidobacteriota bacterium]
MKQVLVILLILIAGAWILRFSWQQGQQRHLYTTERFAKYVPIPELYEDYVGRFEWVDDGRIKVRWTHLDIHPNQTRDYFICEGRFLAKGKYYYLMEMDGKRYIEKEDHVEPLIHALLAMTRGSDPDNHEKTVEASIAALPDDPELLNQLVRRFK